MNSHIIEVKSVRHDKVYKLQYNSRPRPYWKDTPKSWKKLDVVELIYDGPRLYRLYTNSRGEVVFESWHSGSMTPYTGKVLSVKDYTCTDSCCN